MNGPVCATQSVALCGFFMLCRGKEVVSSGVGSGVIRKTAVAVATVSSVQRPAPEEQARPMPGWARPTPGPRGLLGHSRCQGHG